MEGIALERRGVRAKLLPLGDGLWQLTAVEAPAGTRADRTIPKSITTVE